MNVPQSTRLHKNQVVLAGLLSKDPTVKFTNTGKKLCAASICTAVTAKTKTFTRIEEMADVLEPRKTGDFIEVTGRIQSRSWDGANTKLTERDLQMFQRLGIPPQLLERAGVARVSDLEARLEYNFNQTGDLSGLLFPYYNGRELIPRNWSARWRSSSPSAHTCLKVPHCSWRTSP